MRNIHSQESGRSMVEMLGVLAIIGVLSVGGIAGYSQAMSKFKVTKTTDQIQTMVTNIRTLFSTQRTYAGVETKATMYATGIFTDEVCSDGATCTTPTNPFGGTINLTTQKVNNVSKKGFAVTYNGLPADACVRLAMQDWGDSSSGLIAVTVKSAANSVTADAAVPSTESAGAGAVTRLTDSSPRTVPMVLSDAATGCGSSGSASSVTLFYR